MGRVLRVAAIVIVMVAPVVSPVSAASRPTIVAFSKGDFDLGNLNEGPAGDVCAFPVDAVLHALGGGHAIIFDGQGVAFAALGFGALKITITNMDTGKSATVNVSVPGGLNGDGIPIVGWGPWVVFEPIDQGGIRLFHGVTRFVAASYGIHGIPIAGTEEDLCDRVA